MQVIPSAVLTADVHAVECTTVCAPAQDAAVDCGIRCVFLHDLYIKLTVYRLRYEPGTFIAHYAGWGPSPERYARIAAEIADTSVSPLATKYMLVHTLIYIC